MPAPGEAGGPVGPRETGGPRVGSLEAVYFHVSVEGDFRNEFCEDVKKEISAIFARRCYILFLHF